MKRILLLSILSVFTLNIFAQWVENNNIEGKCSHARTYANKEALNPDYNWQSKFIFDYDVTSYIIDIEVSEKSTYVQGNATINCKAIVPIDTFAFELIPEQLIDSVIFNGVYHNNIIRDEDNVLVPVTEVETGATISAKIYYHGAVPSGGFFNGITNDSSQAWKKSVTWTLSEPFSAKDWFPVKQDLQDKADSAILYFTTSSTNMVGSQGLLTNVTDMGDNKLRYEWKTNYPIDYYLISFAVADYVDYSIYAHPEQMVGDSLLIQNFLYNGPGNIEAKTPSLSKTVDIMELYCDLFTLYPFHLEKYGHCETQLGGGMEHQTMSTMGNFSFHLIAHELGHMWFGDNVTCATWSDIWINEGFATYSDYLANEFILGPDAAMEFITKAQEHAMSEDGGSVYIPESLIYQGNEWRIFSGRLTYDKGATIIHMLRHEIQNDELFFEVLRTFQTTFGGGTATGDDFKHVAEQVTDLDFEQFFNQWYYGYGFPVFTFDFSMDENNTLYLSSTQTTTAPATTFFEVLLDFKLHFEDGTDTIVQFRQSEALEVFTMNVDKNVVGVDPDPENWLLMEVEGSSLVDEISNTSVYFTFGPNPVVDNLSIFFLKQDSITRKVLITNINGQLIFEAETKDNKIGFDTSFLRSGLYFISVTDGNNSTVKKFIK
jgi:aminopeptidase N